MSTVCGEVYGRYVPQSVNNKDGQPLDVDIVVNEIFNDGDELFVEFSNGPVPYKVRWAGRPRTPPFRWGDGVEVLPPHDTWLRELDLKMLFLLQSADGAATSTTSGEQLGSLTLPQFRAAMATAKVITPRFPPEKVDEIFTGVATAETTLARKVTALFRECFAASSFPELQRRLERFTPAVNNSNALLLLRKGRKTSKRVCVVLPLRPAELALIAVFAKQRGSDPETFALHPQPLEYDYDQFERLLLGAAWTTYNNRRKAAPGPAAVCFGG
eukprot:XP_001699020.1 predicted protein [Chlamydomonas reinhardtii]